MSLLEFDNVTLRFGGVVAVNQVSFNVEEGEVFALVGPNGAGKSTVFNLISRFYDPAEGDIRFDGKSILLDTSPRHRQARHRAHLPEHRTVRAGHRAAEPAGRPPPAPQAIS
jgi:branched-chain amino acid transport system ATP-binding protein